MSITVNKGGKKTKDRFGDLESGDVFEYNAETFLKVEEGTVRFENFHFCEDRHDWDKDNPVRYLGRLSNVDTV